MKKHPTFAPLKTIVVLVLSIHFYCSGSLKETLSVLSDDQIPQTHEQLWADFDPRAEPLDVEVLKEWEEDGVVLQVLRYRVGVFKGQKAKVAAVYGYPKGGTNLPGLVQIHGGGQYADYRAPLTNAKRGYATLSVSWAGRINAPGHKVTPAEVKLYWAGDVENPNYKVTTEWGALDGYHAPSKHSDTVFGKIEPYDWTIDSVDSPRNSPWYLATMAARRGLTLLERRAEVDPNRLGVYGHSMGGKLTVQVAGSDSRVKAAVPSCGGVSDRPTDNELYSMTIGDAAALKNLSCPILFQSPSNDFHGRIDDLQVALTEIQSDDWRMVCSPHHNHQDLPAYEITSQLWFDQHLKGLFEFPETPELKVTLNSRDGIPSAAVRVDSSQTVLSVDVFYTQQGQIDGLKNDRDNTKNKFWHYANTVKVGDDWNAKLPVSDSEKPLWVYANVTYALSEPVTCAGYYYKVRSSEKFYLSSRTFMAGPEELAQAGVLKALSPSLVIETFGGEWDNEWFTYDLKTWGRKTHKVYSPLWKAPCGATLAFEIRADETNKIVIGMDSFACEVDLLGGNEWQKIQLSVSDFKDATGESLEGWDGIKEFRYAEAETLRRNVDGKKVSLKFGGKWKGTKPKFRNLRWVY